FEILFVDKKDLDKAYSFANEAADKYFKDNAFAHNSIAWHIVDPDAEAARRDLDLAIKLSTLSEEMTPSWENYDTLARGYFLKKDDSKAIDFQKKDVEGLKKVIGKDKDNADNYQQYLDELQGRLDEYSKKGDEKK